VRVNYLLSVGVGKEVELFFDKYLKTLTFCLVAPVIVVSGMVSLDARTFQVHKSIKESEQIIKVQVQ
jgi:cell division protein FtsL